jgi:hypothetical protein
VARAGVTTVILSPYRASSQGSRLSAIHTAGTQRDRRVVRDTAGIAFDLSDADPVGVGKTLGGRLEAGKKYLESWQKYENELAEWKKKQAEGDPVNGKPVKEDAVEKAGEPDPITGTWRVTISGGPIPEPQTATMRLRLDGSDIEGRMAVPGEAEEVKVVATLDGTHISGHIEVDTGGNGYPGIEADIVGEDHIVGKISFQGVDVDLDAERTDKEAVEFKVVKRRTRGKGGRPLPPKVDDALEPFKAALEQTVPLVVSVETPAQVAAVLSVGEKFDVPVVLHNAADAAPLADKLVERSVGVIVPKQVMRWVNDRPYHQADDLARKGVAIAFQSGAEDAARALPMGALRSVERGLSADAALAALTTQASRMFKLDGLIGSLARGKQGDLVIFSGHPFSAGSRIERVIIQGEEVR